MPMADETSLFFGRNTKTVTWDGTTHISANKEELGDMSKKDSSCEEAKREDFGG